MRKITQLMFLGLAAALVAFGQYSTIIWPVSAPLANLTSASGAIPVTSLNVCLASATGVNTPSLSVGIAGSFLYADKEMMQVVAAGVGGATCFRVKRGQMGTLTQGHAVNAAVWVANAAGNSGDPSRPFYNGNFPMEDASPPSLAGQQPAFGTTPSSAVPVAGSIYWSELLVEHSRPVTGICILNGATVGTDNHIFALYDFAGNLLGQTASTLAASASLYQCLPLVTPIEISGFRSYFIAVQSNGTTAVFQKYITGEVGLSFQAGSQTGTFATIPAVLAVPATFTTATGPIGALY